MAALAAAWIAAGVHRIVQNEKRPRRGDESRGHGLRADAAAGDVEDVVGGEAVGVVVVRAHRAQTVDRQLIDTGRIENAGDRPEVDAVLIDPVRSGNVSRP